MAEAKHGTRRRYKQGCRCVECREANREYVRAWREKKSLSDSDRRRRERLTLVAGDARLPGTWAPAGCVKRMRGLIDSVLADGKVEAGDPVTSLRFEQLMIAAAIMDDPKQAKLFRDQVGLARDVLQELGIVEVSSGAGPDEASEILAAIRGAS